MSGETKVVEITVPASADLSGFQYRAVFLNASGSAGTYISAMATAIGGGTIPLGAILFYSRRKSPGANRPRRRFPLSSVYTAFYRLLLLLFPVRFRAQHLFLFLVFCYIPILPHSP